MTHTYAAHEDLLWTIAMPRSAVVVPRFFSETSILFPKGSAGRAPSKKLEGSQKVKGRILSFIHGNGNIYINWEYFHVTIYIEWDMN